MHLLRRLLHPLRVVALIAATLFCMCSAAGAATDVSTPLQPGWNIQSATVVCPGAPQRTLTSVQAATFLQSWLPDSFFSKLKTQDPPSGVTRCTVTVPWTISGQPAQTPAQIGYATDGTHVWVRLPPSQWSIPRQTQRVITSFLGHGTYVPVATTPATASPATTTAPKPHTTHGSSNSWVWFAVAAAVVVLIVLATLRSRSGRAAPRRSSPQPAASSAKRRR
jgi:hypothetical protein